jgi:hypothetical protein
MYWKHVREEWTAPTRRVFVDKMPLNAVSLGLIAKLFPNAKILLAVRDPRDVVLSCFRRRFGMTQHMYELLTLRDAAVYYDAVMTLVKRVRDKTALRLFEARHETLVSDFSGETGRLCAFLGIAPNAEMEQFAVKSQQRHINTPSAAQVARGLTSQGLNQWRNYTQSLAEVKPLLTPWVSHFGYSSEW